MCVQIDARGERGVSYEKLYKTLYVYVHVYLYVSLHIYIYIYNRDSGFKLRTLFLTTFFHRIQFSIYYIT